MRVCIHESVTIAALGVSGVLKGCPRVRASVRGRAHPRVRSKLDQLIHQASKDATKAAAVKAAKQERRIVTAM